MTFAVRPHRDANGLVNIANKTVSVTDNFATYDSGAYWSAQSNGLVGYYVKEDGVTNPATNPAGEWLVVGDPSDFEIYVENIGLDPLHPSSAAETTWLPLTTTRTWNIQSTSVGETEATLAVQIRNATSGVIMDTATITLRIINNA